MNESWGNDSVWIHIYKFSHLLFWSSWTIIIVKDACVYTALHCLNTFSFSDIYKSAFIQSLITFSITHFKTNSKVDMVAIKCTSESWKKKYLKRDKNVIIPFKHFVLFPESRASGIFHQISNIKRNNIIQERPFFVCLIQERHHSSHIANIPQDCSISTTKRVFMQNSVKTKG